MQGYTVLVPRNRLELMVSAFRFFVFIFLLAANPKVGAAEIYSVEPVEVEYEKNWNASYRDRRSILGWEFALLSESGAFNDYLDPITGAPFSQTYSRETLRIYQLQVGLRFNTVIGSLSTLLEVGGADLKSPDEINKGQFIKKSAIARLTFDTITSEPFVAPYLGVQLFTWDYKISRANGPSDLTMFLVKGSTPVAMGVQAGLLIQLNKLDPATTKTARIEYSMQNTFLDIYFLNSPGKVTNSNVNLNRGTIAGLGLRSEF